MRSIGPKIIEKPVRSISEGADARLGVLEQVERSWKPGNRLATLMGAMLGGFIPLASYTIYDCAPRSAEQASSLAAGGLRPCVLSVNSIRLGASGFSPPG
jgi:hypothetical protein